MTSHGVPRHGRYERLLRKHRFDTRDFEHEETVLNDQRVTVPEGETAQSKNLHEQWMAMHEKREQVLNPSTTLIPAIPEVTSTATEEVVATTEAELTPSETTTTTSGDSTTETEPAHESETTTNEIRPTTDTAPLNEPESTTSEDESATTMTQPVVSETTSFDISVSTSDQQTIELPTITEAIVEPASTTVTTSTSNPATETNTEAGTESPTVPEVNTSGTVETSTTTELSDSTTETVSESASSVAGLTAESQVISTSTSTLDSTFTDNNASATLSTSVPVIDKTIESSDKIYISLGSSLNIPTAVVVGQTLSSTSTEAVITAIAAESSTSSSHTTETTTTTTDTSTNTTNTPSTTSTTFATTITTTTSDTTLSLTSSTTTTTTTSHLSHTTYSDSLTGGYGWRDDDSLDNTAGVSPESTGAGFSGSESNSDSGSGTFSPQATGKIVGGVVGGVAAATVIFLLVFLLLRRRRKTGFFFGSPARVKGDDSDGGLIREPSTRQMVSRDSDGAASFGAAYFAPAFMKRWRQSQMSIGEESLASTAPSERGFQKISGRKLPSGIHPDLDYSLETGSPTESDISPTLPPVIPRSPTSSRPPPSNPFSAPLDTSFTREVAEDDVVFVRPSPARTPTAGSSNATSWADASARAMPMAFPMPPVGTLASIPKRPDALGRSHPSYDGSRGSRFSENL
ncbi:hypothetical protein BJY00DRAFT_123353 [Aspergillus carlsbadensis]|nr:hypothetical protein BJY00DRAFT_123353 [Aspergillus carlsbadensis]